MAYPERGANYKHEPKFIERMKRAEGGGVGKQPADNQDGEGMVARPFGPTGHESIDAQGKVHGMKRGGSIHMTAGSESGPGRLEKTEARARAAKHEKPQSV